MKDELLRIANSLYTVVDDLYKLAEQPEPPKSAHKLGEPFNYRWEYAGELKIPEIGEDTFAAVSSDGKETGLVAKGYKKDFNNGLREILRPRKPAEKYKVGDVVTLKGWHGLPDGDYKILSNDKSPKDGDIYINYQCLAVVSRGDFSSYTLPIIAPLSLDWYNFKIEGVTCRAYEGQGNGTSYRSITFSDSQCNYVWTPKSGKPFDRMFDAVDARLKAERGYGIIAVPFEVSGGNFEAPK